MNSTHTMDKGKGPCTELSYESLVESDTPVCGQHFKETKFALDLHRRRNLPSTLWAKNIRGASLVRSEEAAHGKCTLDEVTRNQCISSLRQINEATNAQFQHINSKSTTILRNAQPAVVQGYLGANKAGSQKLEDNVRKAKEITSLNSGYMKMKLLATEEQLALKKMMSDRRQDVADNMEHMSIIFGKSKYNPCYRSDAHMPPYGHGDPILPTVDMGSASVSCQTDFNSNKTYPEYMGSRAKDDQPSKSKAHGKLENIMLSSNAILNGKMKEKARVISGKPCRKQKEGRIPVDKKTDNPRPLNPNAQSTSERFQSKKSSFASMLMDSANRSKQGTDDQCIPATFLTGQPAQPHTSNAAGHKIEVTTQHKNHKAAAYISLPLLFKPDQNKLDSSTLNVSFEEEEWKLDLGILSCIFPWTRYHSLAMTSTSHAEATLRELLRATDIDKKVRYLDYYR